MASTSDSMLKKHLKDDIKSLCDNFLEIIKMSKVGQQNSAPFRAQEHLEVIVRASNMVRAQQSLLNLICNIRKFIIINDFSFINDILQNGKFKADEIDHKLIQLKNELSNELFILEDEYYNSHK